MWSLGKIKRFVPTDGKVMYSNVSDGPGLLSHHQGRLAIADRCARNSTWRLRALNLTALHERASLRLGLNLCTRVDVASS